LILFSPCFNISAQEAIPTSGGVAIGTGGTVNYSIGQAFCTLHSDTKESLAEGVQQPYEISVVSGIEETRGISLSFRAFPNPTTDYLKLTVESIEMRNLSYHIYDIRGRLVEKNTLSNTETIIDFRKFTPAVYMLKLTVGNTNVKTFKIIKR
ncbi:MAG: T9SS type A sorting domain-containing protein, partial [Bacteroidales bacterium]